VLFRSKKKGGIEALPEKVKPKMASLMADASIERFLEKVAVGRGQLSTLEQIARLRNFSPEDWLNYYSTPGHAALLDVPDSASNRFVDKIKGIPSSVSSGFSSFKTNMGRPKFRRNFLLGTGAVAGAGGLAAALSAIGSGKPEKSQLKEAKMKKSAWKIAEELYTPEDVEWANEFGRLSPEEQRKRSPNPNLPLRIIHAGGAAGQEDLPLEDMREMMKDWNYKSKEAACATPGKKIRSEGKGQGLARGKGKGPVGRFKKKAAEIAEMIIQKNAASSTDFIDKMRSKADN
jgi:hypothetical protein